MIVPSPRALTLVALAAPLAVLIGATVPGAWIVAPAAGISLILLVLLDGLLAGMLRDFRLETPGDGEVGQPVRLTALAEIARNGTSPAPDLALSLDEHLAKDGRTEASLTTQDAPQIWSGTIELIPNRRGTATVERAWLRWSGPLRLAHRQTCIALNREIRIWPDLSPVRSPTLQAYLRDSQFGLVARRLRGEGTQFEALSEFEPGMDRRRIDWKASARHTTLYARENEAERDNQIVFAIDCGQAMCEPVDGLPRLDRAVSAALTASYVALKGGDRVALFGFADHPQIATPFITETDAFYRLQTAAAALDYVPREPNFTLGLSTLTARLKRRSLIVLFSDFTDLTSAELMLESVGRLIRHHLVIFVTMEDTELDRLTSADPARLDDIATAVMADRLARQRALVLEKLRRMGVDVIEAPWEAIGFQLIDHYLEARGAEAIG
ncbi:DUF58 domain-containing protein [Altericroceibacterium spongiae]|uniref:DUF58 domain-containing protein n=1 Tax=Altericroceibacterium spongiae TaxID=2320269 RepID=A0A420EBW0_9SPHN|nr:DUF58 domain-containing protein [Altericroceibacterium spongiae]RKF18180.1 DUF58 domain-containing protein [Altericroceibacterium spongiae]